MSNIRNIISNLRGGQQAAGRANAAGKAIVEELCREGQRLIEEAYDFKETEDKLYNQRDGYGYAVYHNGKLVEGTMGFLDGEMSKRAWRKGYPKGRGRDLVTDYLRNYSAPERGYTLVVANAMPYSMWQEKGLVPTVMRRYRIMSNITGELEELALRFKGKVEYNW